MAEFSRRRSSSSDSPQSTAPLGFLHTQQQRTNLFVSGFSARISKNDLLDAFGRYIEKGLSVS